MINSVGTPANQAYSSGKVIKGYKNSDTDPKVIVTRIKLPGSNQLI